MADCLGTQIVKEMASWEAVNLYRQTNRRPVVRVLNAATRNPVRKGVQSDHCPSSLANDFGFMAYLDIPRHWSAERHHQGANSILTTSHHPFHFNLGGTISQLFLGGQRSPYF